MPLASRYVRSPSLVAGVSGLSRKRRSRPEPVAQVELHGDPLDVDSDPRLLDDEGLRRSRGWTSPAPARPGLRQPPRPRRLPLPRTLTLPAPRHERERPAHVRRLATLDRPRLHVWLAQPIQRAAKTKTYMMAAPMSDDPAL